MPKFQRTELELSNAAKAILKHCSYNNAVQLGRCGVNASINRKQAGARGAAPRIFADEIAYNNHDVDDGIRGRASLPWNNCSEVPPLPSNITAKVLERYPDLGGPPPGVRDPAPP